MQRYGSSQYGNISSWNGYKEFLREIFLLLIILVATQAKLSVTSSIITPTDNM